MKYLLTASIMAFSACSAPDNCWCNPQNPTAQCGGSSNLASNDRGRDRGTVRVSKPSEHPNIETPEVPHGGGSGGRLKEPNPDHFENEKDYRKAHDDWKNSRS